MDRKKNKFCRNTFCGFEDGISRRAQFPIYVFTYGTLWKESVYSLYSQTRLFSVTWLSFCYFALHIKSLSLCVIHILIFAEECR
jgi:hypothetical protein